MTKWTHLIGVGAALFAASAFAQAPSAQQVRSWAAACSNCHGTNGLAREGMDKLAGVNADDLQKKLLAFKSGARPATVMHQLAKGYSDEQLAAISAYFAAQKP